MYVLIVWTLCFTINVTTAEYKPEQAFSLDVNLVICIVSCSCSYVKQNVFEPRHEISNNVVCATSKASDQPAHTRSLIRAFLSRLNILLTVRHIRSNEIYYVGPNIISNSK